MSFDFNAPVSRLGTHAVKYDLRRLKFGVDDVLPMWVADMDLPTPPAISEALARRAAHPIYGYTMGHEPVYEAITGWQQRRHGWAVQRAWIKLVTNVVQTLSLCVQAFTEPGDGVVTITPVYDPIMGVITRNDRKLQRAPLRYEEGAFHLDAEALEAAITPETRALIVCSPHNPTGRVWRPEELDIIARAAEAHDLVVISDEIHADLVHEGRRHTPTAAHSEALAARCVTLSSPSKTFNTPGLMAAYAITPDARLRARLAEVLDRQFLHGPNIFGLVGLEAAYAHGEGWYQGLMDHLAGNIARARSFIKAQIPQARVAATEATYLLWIDFAGLDLPVRELQRRLVHEAKLGLTPGRQYGPEGADFLRMNVAVSRATLEEALRRLASVL